MDIEEARIRLEHNAIPQQTTALPSPSGGEESYWLGVQSVVLRRLAATEDLVAFAKGGNVGRSYSEIQAARGTEPLWAEVLQDPSRLRYHRQTARVSGLVDAAINAILGENTPRSDRIKGVLDRFWVRKLSPVPDMRGMFYAGDLAYSANFN